MSLRLKIMYKKAFTLLEVMMALVVVSVMLAVLAPVMTVSPKSAQGSEIKVMDSTPVGVIVAWYGSNYPQGWLSLDGQSIMDPKYDKLRNTLGMDNLPNLNGGAASPTGLYWIIKAQ